MTDALLPGRQLWLFATGTGIAPFASLVRDPEVHEKFEKIILWYGTRKTAELQYRNDMIKATLADLLVGSAAQQSLILINATTCIPIGLGVGLRICLTIELLEKLRGRRSIRLVSMR